MRTGGGEQNALQSGDRLRRVRVEVGEMIVAFFERRLIFEANAQAHTESAGYLPIVIQIPVVAGLQQRQRWPDGELAPVRRTEQSAGQTVAGRGGRRGRVGAPCGVPARLT